MKSVICKFRPTVRLSRSLGAKNLVGLWAWSLQLKAHSGRALSILAATSEGCDAMKLVGRKMSRRISIAVALPLLLLGSSETKSAPANTLRELYTAIGECVKSARAGLPGSELTILFSLKRDG